MALKLGNLLATLPLFGALYVFLQLRPDILGVLSCLAKLGPGHPVHDRLSGLIAIALIVLGVVCAARLISAERTNDK